jgi:hypothetical protein
MSMFIEWLMSLRMVEERVEDEVVEEVDSASSTDSLSEVSFLFFR